MPNSCWVTAVNKSHKKHTFMVSKIYAMLLLTEVNHFDFLAGADNGCCYDFTVA